jgi:hypothetical protein
MTHEGTLADNEIGAALAPQQTAAMGPTPTGIAQQNVAVATSLALNAFENEINQTYNRWSSNPQEAWYDIGRLASERYAQSRLTQVQLVALAIAAIANRWHMARTNPNAAPSINQQNRNLVNQVFGRARGIPGDVSITSLRW